jgi:gas vesicle protein
LKEKKYNYIQLGMLFGIFIGGAIGVLLFVFTEDP